MDGLTFLKKAKEQGSDAVFIIMTAFADVESAVEAMKAGAENYLTKPVSVDALLLFIAKAVGKRKLERDAASLRERVHERFRLGGMVGESPELQAIFELVKKAAPTKATVLILGESGTGKELIAQALHEESPRRERPFIKVSCAALSETLLESELFGHERGAFTGADRRRIGKFEQCSGGTLFLDEIGDMTPLTQAKVLRVLQDGRFERVGGNETIRADVRVIAATNRDLEQMVAAGEFRGDLYYRLGIVTITLPPLRERAEDLPLLIDHFLRRFSPELGKQVDRIAPEALEVLRRHHWPGNIRELQSVLKQALLRAKGPVLVADFLPASVRGEEESAGTSPAAFDWEAFLDDRFRAGSQDLYAESLAVMERSLLTRVLRHTGGNQVQAAKLLGITRGSLRTKIRTLGIQIGRSVWSAGDQPGP